MHPVVFICVVTIKLACSYLLHNRFTEAYSNDSSDSDVSRLNSRCNLDWMCGLQAASELCSKARDAGLIVITAGKGDVVRLVPPLVVSDEDIEKCCKILGDVAKQVLV